MTPSLAFLHIFFSWLAPIRLLPMPASQANTMSLTSLASFTTRSVMSSSTRWIG